MPVLNEPLTDKAQTVKRIFELAETFKRDLEKIQAEENGELKPLSRFTLAGFFNFVKNIPYQRDREPVEIVARPKIIIQRAYQGYGKDCKKAAILLGAYFNIHKMPWKLATVSTRQDRQIHHIFPQVKLSGQFLNVDATYPTMKLFQPKTVTAAECYTRQH